MDLELAHRRVGMSTLPCLSSICSSPSTTTYAMRGVRHSEEIQHAAVGCFRSMSNYDGRLRLLVARRMFSVLNLERATLTLSRTEIPSLPFASGERTGGGGGEGGGGDTGIRSPAECSSSTLPPLAGMQGGGLMSVHASHTSLASLPLRTSNRSSSVVMDGTSLLEECRLLLLRMSVSEGTTEWIGAWMSTCEDVIFAKRGGKQAAVVEEEEEESGDDSEEEGGSGGGGEGASAAVAAAVAAASLYEKQVGALAMKTTPLHVPGSIQMSSLSYWPTVEMPKWQTKTIALECIRQMVRHVARKEAEDRGRGQRSSTSTTSTTTTTTSSSSSKTNTTVLAQYLKRLVRLACYATTCQSTAIGTESASPLGRLQTLGMMLIKDIVRIFADTKDTTTTSATVPQPILLLYEAQLSAAMRSAFDDEKDDDVASSSSSTSSSSTTSGSSTSKAADNIPLALHACSPMAAMLACGISQDPVMARRTIKTLVSGDSSTSSNKSNRKTSLTSLPPR